MQDKDIKAMQRLCREDLFFLLTCAFNRKDINHDWLYERCREVEKNPNGYLDLWAREHYKSTIITFGKSVQDILVDPEITIGVFSHTRPIAKSFLTQIKLELENNTFLKRLFPSILYNEPKRESPRWSTENGIIVKRKSNPKEATVEAWGLVDGQPTSKHFSLLIYDDVVTRESVTTSDQIKKVTDAWALSLNLGAKGGKRRYIGTRYHQNDTYREIMKREAALSRLHPATKDGKYPGKPVFLSDKELEEKRREMGPYIFSAQELLNPTADKAMGFKHEWLSFYDYFKNFHDWNFYLICDPANEKKRDNDYTVMLVIGLGPDSNYYLVDGIRDRLNLTERTDKYMEFHRKYKPINSGYEKYGKDSDDQHIKYIMGIKNYRFNITTLGGSMSKEDRIRRLVPIFEQHRFWFPHKIHYVDYEKNLKDLVKIFLEEEYESFPVSVHDDIFDCMARILDPDLKAEFPTIREDIKVSATMDQKPDKVKTDYDLFD